MKLGQELASRCGQVAMPALAAQAQKRDVERCEHAAPSN
jgi:hypothetical protein